jgi:hypothetical protein
MITKTSLAALLTLACAGAAQAQSCACDPRSTRTANNAALVALLANRMVCGQVDGEKWQEWHNGTGGGPIVDYKLGPTDKSDPSTTVGTYSVSNNSVTYDYGSGGTYKYDVCVSSSGTSYTFCGAQYGGRDISGAMIGGNGLQSCAVLAAAVSARPPVKR